jgi:hypothetical protein
VHDGDGVQEGKSVSKSSRPQLPKAPLESGSTVAIGNLMCEVDRSIPYEEFK